MNTIPVKNRTPELTIAYRKLKIAYVVTALRLLVSAASGFVFTVGRQSEQPALVVLSVLMFAGSIAMIWIEKWDTRYARNNVMRAEFYARYDRKIDTL